MYSKLQHTGHDLQQLHLSMQLCFIATVTFQNTVSVAEYYTW